MHALKSSPISEILFDIGRKKIFLELHTILFRLTGMVFDFITPDGQSLLDNVNSCWNPLCRLIRTHPGGMSACRSCDVDALSKAFRERKISVYTCHAGLTDMVFPVCADERCFGYLTSGQFLTQSHSPAHLKSFIKKIVSIVPGMSENEIKELYEATPYISATKLQAIMDLINLISRYIADNYDKLSFLKKIDENSKITAIRKCIETNYRSKLSVAQAASAVFLSESRFSHLFSQEFGISFVQYLQTYRVNKAKELLAETGLSIIEIALETGFQNQTDFNRVLKK